MALHTVINIPLRVSSINKLIRDLKAYSADVVQATEDLIKALMADGIDIAKGQLMALDAVDTGELQESITGWYDESAHIAIIRADMIYACYVEYGTGIEGANMADEWANPFKPDGWKYDKNHHGEKGWIYFSDRDGKKHWTKGMPARPFMYLTYMELVSQAREKFIQMMKER